MASISATGTGSAAPIAGWARSRRRRSRQAALLGLAALPLLGASPSASVAIDLTGLRSMKGMVRACLTTNPVRFPDCQSDPAARRINLPAAEATHFRFADVPSGDYAVALIHDENGNGKLDTFAGIPREGFGFSRNPAIGFGPPRFGAAAFELTNQAAEQGVRVRYLL